MRAVIDNPANFLTPGMFGNMRLADRGATSALLVPDDAIQTDQADKLVLVVAADGTVGTKRVQLGPLVDGLRVIESGLSGDERVVVSGIQYAAPGSKVEGKPVALPPKATAARLAAPPTGSEITSAP
ncbi:hypothetical protein KCV01_g17065, partial [Aureobasidium melanogenum]